jgi:hypothetical protein
MLTYIAELPDRIFGGVCESFLLKQEKGRQELTVISPVNGSMTVQIADAGRWSFYTGGTHIKTVDLNAPPSRAHPDPRRGGNWMS